MSKEDNQTRALALRGQTYTDAVTFAQALTALRNEGKNVLTPVTWTQSPKAFHEYGLVVVDIDTSVRSREIWHDPRWPKDQHALTHRGLKKLWNSAGGKWTESVRVDDRSIPFYAEYRAAGEIRDLEDRPQSCIRNAHVDYRDKSPDVTGLSEKQVIEMRKKFTERCESLAQNRVMRELLNIGDSYLMSDLEQPFVLAKVVFRPPVSDPEVRQLVIQQSMGAIDALYGPPESRQQAALPPTRESVAEMAGGEPDDNPEAPPAVETTDEDRQRDFEAADPKDQVSILYGLAEVKAFDVSKLQPPYERMNPKQRLAAYCYLHSLAGVPSRATPAAGPHAGPGRP